MNTILTVCNNLYHYKQKQGKYSLLAVQNALTYILRHINNTLATGDEIKNKFHAGLVQSIKKEKSFSETELIDNIETIENKLWGNALSDEGDLVKNVDFTWHYRILYGSGLAYVTLGISILVEAEFFSADQHELSTFQVCELAVFSILFIVTISLCEYIRENLYYKGIEEQIKIFDAAMTGQDAVNEISATQRFYQA